MTIDGEDLRAIQVRTAALDHAVAANEYVEDRITPSDGPSRSATMPSPLSRPSMA